MAIVLKTISDSQQARQDLAKLRESVDGIKTTTENVSKSFLTLGKTIGALASVSFAAKSFMELSDNLTNLENRIRIVTKSQAEFNAVFGQIKSIAMSSRGDLQAIGQLYTKISLATKEMGANQRQVSAVTEAISKSMAVSGASAEEAKNSIQQLGQALASGKLAGDEFRSVMENAPELAKAIAAGMGVSLGKMYELRDAGKLTSRDVFQAILKQQDQINAKFNKLNVTYGSAFKNLGNSLLLLFGSVKDAFLGSSDGLARGINNIALGIASFAKNFKLYLTMAKASAIIFAYEVIDVFKTMWGIISQGPKAVYEAFKNWLAKVFPVLGQALGAAEAYAVKLATAIAGGFAAAALAIKKDGFAATVMAYLSTAATQTANAINRIFKSIVKIDISNIIPGLDKSLAVVKRWAIAVERWFFWVYDQVIGHSWIPDLVEGVFAWVSKLTGGPLKMISTFATGASKLFSNIRFSAPFLGAIGVVLEFHKSLLKIVGVLGVIAALAATIGLASGKLDIKVLANSKAVEYLKGIYTSISKFVIGFKMPGSDKQSGGGFFSRQLDSLNKTLGQLGFIRDLKQILGIQDTIPGSIRGEAINTAGEVGRGPQSNMKDRSFLHDITAMFPPKIQLAFLTTVAGLFGAGVIMATESGAVRNALLALIGSSFVIGIVKNMKVSSLAKIFGDVFKVDTTDFQKRADYLMQKNSGPDAKNTFDRTIDLIPKEAKIPFLTTITALVGAGIVGATSSGFVRSSLLSVLTTVYGIAMARSVPADQIRETFLGVADFFVQKLAQGLTLLFNGSVLKDPFGFLSLIAKTSLLFQSGREYFGKMALGAATSPTKLVNTAADTLNLRSLNKKLAEFESEVGKVKDALSLNKTNLKTALDQLAREVDSTGRKIGMSRAREIANGGDATGIRNSRLVANARAGVTEVNAGTERVKSMENDPGYKDTKAIAESLTGKLREGREKVKQGVRDFAAGSSGAVGAAAGLQYGAEIAAGMEKSPAWMRIGVEIASSMAGQAIGAGIGQAAAFVLIGAGGLLAKGVALVWTAAATRIGAIWVASATRAALIQTANVVKTYTWYYGMLTAIWIKERVFQLGTMAMQAAMWVGAMVGGGALLGAAIIAGVAALIAGIGVVTYMFWDDISNPAMWKALGITLLNLWLSLQETLVNALLYAGTKVYNWLAGLIGIAEAKAATVPKFQVAGGIDQYQWKSPAAQPDKPAASGTGKGAPAPASPGWSFSGMANGLMGKLGNMNLGSMFSIPGMTPGGAPPKMDEPKLDRPKVGGTSGGFSPSQMTSGVSNAVTNALPSLADRFAKATSSEGVASILSAEFRKAGFDTSSSSFLKNGVLTLSSTSLAALTDPLEQIARLQQGIKDNPGNPLNAQAEATIAQLRSELAARTTVLTDMGELTQPLKDITDAADPNKPKKTKDKPYEGLKAGERFSIVSEMFPELQLLEEQFNKLNPVIADSLVALAVPLKQTKDARADMPIKDGAAGQAAFLADEKRRKEGSAQALKVVTGAISPFQILKQQLDGLDIGGVTEKIFDYADTGQRAFMMSSAARLKEINEELTNNIGLDEASINLRRSLQEEKSKILREFDDLGGTINAGIEDKLFGRLKRNIEKAGLQNPGDIALNLMPDAQRAQFEESVAWLAQAREKLANGGLGENERIALATQIMTVTDNISEQLSKLPDKQMKKVKDAGNALASSIHSGLTESLTGLLTGKGFDVKNLLDRISTTVISTIVNGLLDPITGENGFLTKQFKSLGSALFGGANSVTAGMNKPDLSTTAVGAVGGFFGTKAPGAEFGLPPLPGVISGYGGGTWNTDGTMATPPDLGNITGAGLDVSTPNFSNSLTAGIPALTNPLKSATAPLADVASTLDSAKSPVAEGLNTVLPTALGDATKGTQDLVKALPKPGAGGAGAGGGMAGFAGLAGSLVGMLIGGLFADGGQIKGPGTGRSDSILIGASNGEFMVNAEATKQNLPLLHAINDGKLGKLPKFADGGLISTDLVSPVPVATLGVVKPQESKSNTTVVNLNVTGDVSRQTKAEVFRMLPDIANGVNMHNREKGYKG